MIKIGKTLPAKVRAKLPLVGSRVASNWGAECIDIKVSPKYRKVTFVCDEFGEVFTSELSFDDIGHYLKGSEL